MRWSLAFVISILIASPVYAHTNYTGYSGAPGRETCASSCHGGGGGTITVTGFPTSYNPNQQYLLAVQHTSGSTIVNFNASCRIGTGTGNAGVIAAGSGTSTYNVNGETNGVHFTSGNLDSGTFSWTAPPAGTGEVRLYVGGLQGSYGGANTTLTLLASEASSPPGMATNPFPADNATDVSLDPTLAWTAGSGATSHDVYFGTSDPPAFVGNQLDTSYTPPGPLSPATVYYWRIDERNDAGVTTGAVWRFTTTSGLGLPGMATNPFPADNAMDVSLDPALTWTAGSGATSHDVYFGTSDPPAFVGNQLATSYTPSGPLSPATVYYWRIDERNDAGVTTGAVWRFTTMGEGGPDGRATDPSPPNGAENVSTRPTLSWRTTTEDARFDVYLGTSNPPPRVSHDQSDTSYRPRHRLRPHKRYYWRVDVITESGTIVGDLWEFRTRGGGGDDEEDDHDDDHDDDGDHDHDDDDRDSALRVSQLSLGGANAVGTRNTISIPFELPEAANVTLAVFDVMGRELGVLASGSYRAGAHAIEWSSAGYRSGVYILRLTANGASVTRKVMVVK
jgi:hypothetical protein